MSRPLMQKEVNELEEMLEISRTDRSVLKVMEEELQYRQTSHAVALLEKVQEALYGPKLGTVTTPKKELEPESSAAAKQPRLWEEELPARLEKNVVATSALPEQPKPVPPEVPPTKLQESSEAAKVTTPAEVQEEAFAEPQAQQKPSEPALPPLPIFSVEAAYKELGAAPSLSWEDIEKTRRRIVQLSHPENIAAASPEERMAAREAVRRVNAAYAVIFRHRVAASW